MDENHETQRASGKHRFRPARPLPRRPGMDNPAGAEILVLETECFLSRWEMEKFIFMNTMDRMLDIAARRPPLGNW